MNKYYFLFLGLFFLFSSFIVDTRNTRCYWVGGTIGFETEWNKAENWSINHIPDWTTDIVIIPNVSTRSNHFPIINNQIEVIPHLQLESGATLAVKTNGKLIIDGSTTFNYGVINGGKILNKGFISVHSTGMSNLLDINGEIINEGIINLEDHLVPSANR